MLYRVQCKDRRGATVRKLLYADTPAQAETIAISDHGMAEVLTPSQPASTCPTCGTAGALSAFEIRKGYQCGNCTALAEM